MEKIVLLGGGGHCISCIDVIESTALYEIVGILDKNEPVGTTVLGYPVLGNDDEIRRLHEAGCSFHITVGQIRTPKIRIILYDILKSLNAKIPVIVSPTAYVSKHATLGEGTIVMHHAVVNACAKTGVCNIINSMSLLEHETQTGDFCHISTSAILNGQVVIGSRCFIGSNAVVNNNVSVHDDVIVASSMKVHKNIERRGLFIKI